MISDTELKIKGFDILIKSLGQIEAERFIALMLREPFDYTTWQRQLFLNKTVTEISQAAMQSREE